MSGPKVVRIVTREEIIATCQALLARLDAALASWERRCRRADCLDDHAASEGRRRRDAIAALLQTDEFLSLQKQAATEIAFLEGDLDRRLAAAAEAKANAARQERRLAEAAQALLKSLEQSGAPIDAKLRSRLRAAARGQADPQAMGEAFAALSSTAAEDGGADRRKELAAQYRTGDTQPSFELWLSKQEVSPAERRIVAVEKRLAELQVNDDPALAGLQTRVANVLMEGEPRRSLLLDSLELDLARVISASKQTRRLQQEIELALAELRAIAPEECEAFPAKDRRSTAELEAELAAIKVVTAKALARAAAESRRAALLQGLASLGYEANEGMQTAWAADGRLVLRSASRPDYGVEVAGNLTNGRVQMRPVEFAAEGTPQNKQRDNDAETIWCSEVDKLTNRLQEADVELQIERAAPVGMVPVKRVAPVGESDRTQAREGPALKARTLS